MTDKKVDREDRVGWRVQVFWDQEEQWFDGRSVKYSLSSTGQHMYFVEYDDGEQQWEEDVGEHAFRFVMPVEMEDQARHVDAGTHAQELEISKSDHESEEKQQLLPSDSESKNEDMTSIQTAKDLHSAIFSKDETNLLQLKRQLENELDTLTDLYRSQQSKHKQEKAIAKQAQHELNALRTQLFLAGDLALDTGDTLRVHDSRPRRFQAYSPDIKQKYLLSEIRELERAHSRLDEKLQAQTNENDILRERINKIPPQERRSLIELELDIARMEQERRIIRANELKIV